MLAKPLLTLNDIPHHQANNPAILLCEPEHNKTNKRLVRPHHTDQESSMCALWVATCRDPNLSQADSEDSDQTGQLPRLI